MPVRTSVTLGPSAQRLTAEPRRPSTARRAVANGTEIHEDFFETAFLPDYAYRLRATVTEPEFREYVGRLACTPHTPTRTYYRTEPGRDNQPGWSSHLSRLRGTGELAWWHPTESLETTFVRQNGNEWIRVKYEDGYLYLFAKYP